MSELSKLDTSKEYDINGTKLKLVSLEMDENIAKYMEMDEKSSSSDMMKSMKEIVKLTLKESYPDITLEEEKSCMKMKNLMPLLEAVTDVNGLSKGNKKDARLEKIKNAIKARQSTQQDKE